MLNPSATVIVFFVDFCACPTIMFPIRLPPHSRVAHIGIWAPLPFQMKI